VLLFEDSVAFRAEYEDRYRSAWDRGEAAPAKARVASAWHQRRRFAPDYLRQARWQSEPCQPVPPGSAIPSFDRSAQRTEALFAAQSKHASQALGESATKEFGPDPHLQDQSAPDFAPRGPVARVAEAALPRTGLPLVLADHVAHVLGDHAAFKDLPISERSHRRARCYASCRTLGTATRHALGLTGTRTGEPTPADFLAKADVPFEHPDVRVLVDSMFLDGLLPPARRSGRCCQHS
jgi:hypothetical protein